MPPSREAAKISPPEFCCGSWVLENGLPARSKKNKIFLGAYLGGFAAWRP
jgi:hypothetical protein